MKKPTESDLYAAREYLAKRLEAERSMVYNLEILMREAASRVVEILYSANIDPKRINNTDLPLRVQWDINAVIDWFNEAIEDYFETLAIGENEDDRDLILSFILAENHGMTFGERLSDYCSKYRDELILLVGAGLFLGLSKKAVADSIGRNLKKPYRNPELAEGITTPLSYGRGRTNSMFTAISALTANGVGRGWMYGRHLRAEKDGAEGFYTFRNSLVPCSICDSYASYLHPMDDEVPPLHLSCVCGVVYVDSEGKFIRM